MALAGRIGGLAAAGAAVAARGALALGWAGWAVPLGAVQAAGTGLLLWGSLPRHLRGLGPAAAGVLLAALAAGASRSEVAGVQGLAGASHALLYAGLLAVFAPTLRRGQVPFVTRLARRLNPAFHSGMEGYTRAVTLAWCAFFAAQLASSAVLLAAAPGWWGVLTGLPGLLLVAGMALAERTVRGMRFPGMAHISVVQVIRGVRAGGRPAPAAGGAGPPAAGCPGHSGSATPRPDPARDSAPGPAS